jgi:hypothetical protein
MCTVLTLSTQFRENAPDKFSSFSITIETVPETALEGQEQVCCILWDDVVDVIGTQRTLSMGKRKWQVHQYGYGGGTHHPPFRLNGKDVYCFCMGKRPKKTYI